MGLLVGSTEVSEVYVGSSRVQEIYSGSNLIYKLHRFEDSFTLNDNEIWSNVSSGIVTTSSTYRQISWTTNQVDGGQCDIGTSIPSGDTIRVKVFEDSTNNGLRVRIKNGGTNLHTSAKLTGDVDYSWTLTSSISDLRVELLKDTTSGSFRWNKFVVISYS